MPKKTGRPRKEIDFEQFEKLCGLQCTEREIAAWFDTTIDTINARCKEHYGVTFSDIYTQKAELGRIALRRVQMQTALGGNVTMQIWLGKNVLGQMDQQHIEHSGTVHVHFDQEDKSLL